MIEVAGLWELGWSVPIMEADMWEYVLKEFGIEKLNMTPITGIDKQWITEYSNLEELIYNKQDLIPVFVDEKGEVELSDFVHPENALYVFGKGNWSPFNNYAHVYDCKSVRIDSIKPGCLWPHQALALILYNRSKK